MKPLSNPEIRPMRPDDYERVSLPIPPGLYSGPKPPPGFSRRDGRGGTILLPVYGDGEMEAILAQRYAALRARYPGLLLERYVARMPFWQGPAVPSSEDYALVDAPEPLVTTSVSALLVPKAQIQGAAMGFFFQGDHLPSLRERMQGTVFRGITGNLGYYYTPGLIGNEPRWARPWAHNVRYPDFPLPTILSYIGFHLTREGATGEVYSSFLGANPAAVGIRRDGAVDVLSQLEIARYEVTLGGQRFAVEAIDDPHTAGRDVALFTPALRTVEVEGYIAATEACAGAADGWQTYAAMVPLADADERMHVFVTNEGDGQFPIEKAIALWEGPAPVPSFGAVLSFKRAYFESLFGHAERFRRHVLGTRVQIVPHGGTPFGDYVRMLGGFVPAVVDGEHILCVDTASQVLHSMSRYSSANSPIALAAQESRNFDLYIREPAGVLIQTEEHIGWVLFDGRHELSIGASVVDVGVLLHKLQAGGMLPAIDQAAFVDGGSAMKVYHVVSDEETVQLDLLNRVAAGPRNRAGADPDGLNLYTTLALRLAGG
jgi:hypothetical protein